MCVVYNVKKVAIDHVYGIVPQFDVNKDGRQIVQFGDNNDL